MFCDSSIYLERPVKPIYASRVARAGRTSEQQVASSPLALTEDPSMPANL